MPSHVREVIRGKKTIAVHMDDGREIALDVPVNSSLWDAPVAVLQNFSLSPSGQGLHWPDLDEDLFLPSQVFDR